MAYFLKSGNTFRISSKEEMDLHDSLPVGTYLVKIDAFENLYLEKIDDFEFKSKRYGDNIRNTERIYNTFMSRPGTTGVMLTGEKGSGKSLLAKSIAIRGYHDGVPTIVVNTPFCGDKFNSFVQTIDQPVIMLFDEFEKVYDSDDQQRVLTLLDGVFSSKKLFLLTCNDKWRIDQHMRNRPGRIFYMLEFKGLDASFITEYCEDNLQNKEHIDSICKLSTLFGEFNFDILKAMVEELNRYGETPQEVMRLLNAKPEFEDRTKHAVAMTINGKDLPADAIEYTTWHGNPLQRVLSFDYDPNPSDDESEWETATFYQTDLVALDAMTGKFTFVNEQGNKLTLTRVRDNEFDYFRAF